MKKIWLLAALVLIIGGIIYWRSEIKNDEPSESASITAADYRSIAYEIDGKRIELIKGYAESEMAPGSASKLVTRYFGNEAEGDLNGDGLPDKAFLLTQNGGGSGEFFYVAVALRRGDGYVGSNAVLLGDRIAPQSTNIADGKVVVNYAERRPNEPMTSAPSIGVSKYFKVIEGRLVEVK